MTTTTQIANLIADIAKLAGLSNSRQSATAANQTHYLTYENAAVYGGYRLIMVNVINGGHAGAFGGNGSEPRLKPSVFIVKLQGILAGLQTEKIVPTIDIVAKEWFDKVNGNSYFAARVVINGSKVVNVPFQYGYGDQYLQAITHQLQTDGLLPEGELYSLPRYCRENGIKLTNNMQRNCLKRELKALID